MNGKVVLIHVPKTAGSSLRAVLAHALGSVHGSSRRLIGVDGPQEGLPYFEGLAASAARRLPELFEDGLQVISGHFRYRDIVPLLGQRRNKVSVITFLRDPVRRTLSDYYYSSSDRHPGSDAFRTAYPTLEAYTRNSGEMNKQVDYLRPFENAPLDLTIANALQNIDFIGLTERFDVDAGQLLDALHAPYLPQSAQNVSADRNPADEAYERHRALLEEILAPDIALYDAVARHRRLTV